MLVNETVKFVYERVAAGLALDGLLAEWSERARRIVAAGEPAAGVEAANGATTSGASTNGAVSTNGAALAGGVASPSGNGAAAQAIPVFDEVRAKFDLYRILAALRDRDLCDYPYEALFALLPPGRVLRGATQVMPLSLADETSAFVDRAMQAQAGVINGDPPPARVFFAFPPPGRFLAASQGYFGKEPLVRRQLDQQEVCFVGVDAAGTVEACTAILGLPQQPSSLMALFVIARDGADFLDRVGAHLARLIGLLQVTSVSAKLRFQYATEHVHLDPTFLEVLGELGFRRTFHMTDELGPGRHLIGYDRALF